MRTETSPDIYSSFVFFTYMLFRRRLLSESLNRIYHRIYLHNLSSPSTTQAPMKQFSKFYTMLSPPLTRPQVPKLSITTTNTISLSRIPSKTATTREVQRWILSNFIFRGVHPHQVPWVEDRVLWNGADLRRYTLVSARKALEE